MTKEIHTENVVGRDNMYCTLIGARSMGFIKDDIFIYKYGYTENKI